MTPKWLRLTPLLRKGKWNVVHVLDAIMESSLSGSQKLILLALVAHRSKRQPRPSPGMRRLSAMCSLHHETVGQNVDALERASLLRIDRRHRQAHLYDLDGLMLGLLACPPASIGADRIQDTPADRIEDTAGPVDVTQELTGSAGRADRIRGVKLTGSKTPKGQLRDKEGTNSASTSDAGSSTASLFSTNATPKLKAPRKPKARHPDPANGAKHRALVAFYFEAFERKRGSKPIGFDGADGRAISKLLDKCKGEVEQASTVITNALASWKGDTVTIRQIAANPSEFASAQKRPNGRTPTQPNYGVNVNAEIVEG
jgi:hypothetical protein